MLKSVKEFSGGDSQSDVVNCSSLRPNLPRCAEVGISLIEADGETVPRKDSDQPAAAKIFGQDSLKAREQLPVLFYVSKRTYVQRVINRRLLISSNIPNFSLDRIYGFLIKQLRAGSIVSICRKFQSCFPVSALRNSTSSS